ncbi:MAG: GxxExxY protein [Candidatus Liptonbacteria bacterium]|nr:GxxExxY protein [Candidatus Liptonbacteria bacterium]
MRNSENKIIYPELSYKINGILFNARKMVGRFANEKQYCDAIEELLKRENVLYEREKALPQSFTGEANRRNIVDFLIDNKIIIETKSKPFVTKEDYFLHQTKTHFKFRSSLNIFAIFA